MNACENGDYPTVSRILESIKDFNIDVCDNLGRSALRQAVENEHLEVGGRFCCVCGGVLPGNLGLT